MRTFAILAVAGALIGSGLPQAAAASTACRNAGTAVGAVGGAVIGSNVAARNARTEGAVLGGLVGAVAGHEVAKRNCDTQCRTRAYYSDGRKHSVRECLDRNGRWRRG